MADSLADWLALREGVDHASRSVALATALVAALPSERPLRVVDLGSGTGSNVRYLAPRLPTPQRWVVVDRDAGLMERSRGVDPAIESREMNLGALDESVVAGAHLVTASALLDLVSAEWLCGLARTCRRHDATAFFALSYNGRAECEPAEPEDEHIRALFNAHQRRSDKGFGAAAGPDAVQAARRAFEEAGYTVRTSPSDWRLTPEMSHLQAELIEGWASAVGEIAPGELDIIESWRRRRRRHVAEGRSRIVVGHDDLLATLSSD